jgi:hypothetical protein
MDAIIGNLREMQLKSLRDAKTVEMFENLLSLGGSPRSKPAIPVWKVRSCQKCRKDLIVSTTEKCGSCGHIVQSDELRNAAFASDSILGILEDRSVPPRTAEAAEFICFLVWLRTRILDDQANCDSIAARDALQLMGNIYVLDDGGAIVDLQDPKSPQIHVVQDRMKEDSQTYAVLLCGELIALRKYLENCAGERS